jgi:asparagine synthase (glutamine-hydrolysing)
MCGITGYFAYKKSIDKTVIDQMCQELSHRGPDDFGTYIYDYEQSQIALGHTRLSIIDLTSGGHQPMKMQHLDIVFNGEIYNYQEIKIELLKLGCVFESNSDTEVILHAFDKWGIESINRFIGMFSFILLDLKTHKIYCVRDRAGVKPFYYYKGENDFIWASELKSFHKHPFFEKKMDSEALKLYLQYGYIPAPHTIYRNTYKLLPGSYLEIDLKTGKSSENSYWNVNTSYSLPKNEGSEEEILIELEDLLVSSCKYRMVSDVPVGVFLSGGYDSSLVAALLQSKTSNKIKTFTIGFKEAGFDEAPFAREIANHLGTEHHEFYCSEQDAKEVIPLLPFMYDEPFGDSSAIPTFLVSKMAKKYVTVALSADGGDETFFGYNRYPGIINRFNRISHWSKIKKMVIKLGLPLARMYYRNDDQKKKNIEVLLASISEEKLDMQNLNSLYSQRFTEYELKNLLIYNGSREQNRNTFFKPAGAELDHMSDVDKLLSIDYKTYLVDDVLTKVDRATMAVSLEGREPLLDHRLIEFAARVPMKLKFKNNIQKYLLKQIAHKYIPKSLLDRPKSGFAIPLKKWFRTDMKYLLEEFLDREFLQKQGIFNPIYVQNLLKKYYEGQDSVFEKIWFLLVFQMWYKQWMNEL